MGILDNAENGFMLLEFTMLNSFSPRLICLSCTTIDDWICESLIGEESVSVCVCTNVSR